ncbi:5-methylthioadenosine/S-adenosylhomocysteine deaminase-like [Eucalyptus grandis]|uniref:5-methylthioadenosine/S-adenosylhomocysteine deaminase-like n=1 Tax=Eucalyptus grandis TaxID=71139 RepID=UPI00192E86CD|nr:5-methylthioadenosine/S-adenosylhomocysteine deaminase-like [Eucalyptus grandis]
MEAPGGLPILLLHNATVVTMDSESLVYGNCAVIIERDRIKAVGHLPDLLRRFRGVASEVVDLRGQILLPSFVNTHVHTSQQLTRGISDDVDLVTWLHDRIWPYEASMTEEDSYVSTLLCGIELIHSGVSAPDFAGFFDSSVSLRFSGIAIKMCW